MKFTVLIICVSVFQSRSNIVVGRKLQKCSKELRNPALIVPTEFSSNGEELTFEIAELSDANWCKDGTLKAFQFAFHVKTFTAQIIPPRQNPALPNGHSGWVNFSSSSEGGNENVGEISSYFLNNGSLKIREAYFPPHSYCIKTNSGDEITGDACIPNCPGGLCIKKCCKEEFYASAQSKAVRGSTRHLSPHYTISPPSCGTVLSVDGVEEPAEIQFYTSLQLSASEDRVAWKLLEDGSVWWNKANRGWVKLSTPHYCVDGILNFGEGPEYRGLASDQALVVCPNDKPNLNDQYSILYTTVMFISAVFLLLTAIVYISLLDLQNVHGWTILSQVTSMFFMYIFLASAHLYGLRHTADENGGVCAVIGVIAHFFFISTFCWLTLINFDLCYTFRSLKPGGSGKTKGLKRYLCYFAFALVLPLTVIITGFTLEHFYGQDIESDVVLPHYGVALCYVAVSAQGVYVYSIVGTLLATNVILISITGFTIYKLKQSTKGVIKSSTSTNQSYLLFVKLFIVMGVTWIFEIISWADINGRETDEIPWYWVIFDVINILQAIAIFIIFVCKRRIVNQLKTKYPQITHGIRSMATFCCKRKNGENAGEGEIEAQTAQTSLAHHSKESIETHM